MMMMSERSGGGRRAFFVGPGLALARARALRRSGKLVRKAHGTRDSGQWTVDTEHDDSLVHSLGWVAQGSTAQDWLGRG